MKTKFRPSIFDLQYYEVDIVQRELGNFFPPLFPPLPLYSY